jgi:maltooligosyltrehalose trehalohydrolase
MHRGTSGEAPEPTRLGATVEQGGTRFVVVATRPRRVDLWIEGQALRPLCPNGSGEWELFVPGVGDGARYGYLLDGGDPLPDPASRWQPDGVHGLSAVVDGQRLRRSSAAPRRALAEAVFYELHVGTFTRAGTLEAAARRLPELVALGVTVVELMPLAAFSGRRNWGYDGVAWFAVQESYGGPVALARFIDEAHRLGLLVVLDVVYNHLGPEGNVLGRFVRDCTTRQRTPWGEALAYANPALRRYVLESAEAWVHDFGVDGLRLDAVHAIVDDSPRHLVAELTARVQAMGHREGRAVWVIAESDLGSPRVVESARIGGWGCDACWSEDVHHALHAAVTGESHGYYADYSSATGRGPLEHLAAALSDGWAYTGQPAPSRGDRAHGAPVRHLPAERFVLFAQNHDQVGNRAHGERLATLAPWALWAVATVVLLAPGLPLLFMGEESGDEAPFLYFVDFDDAVLAEAVRAGRRREHPSADAPLDPSAVETFQRSVVDEHRSQGAGAGLWRYYQGLLRLRRSRPSLARLDRCRVEARALIRQGVLLVRRWSTSEETLIAVALTPTAAGPVAEVAAPAPRSGAWELALDAGHPLFGGPGGARTEPEGHALRLRLPLGAALVLAAEVAS